MTDDLSTRLQAAIDGRESAAKGAQPGPWHVGNADGLRTRSRLSEVRSVEWTDACPYAGTACQPAEERQLILDRMAEPSYLTFTGQLTDEEFEDFRERLEQARLRPTSLLINGEVSIRRRPWWRRLDLRWWQREAR